ncbi:carboxymuconolactone decarboxylase family protein [Microbacterium yannicii]|uniref:Carboxymuconolactone decarboxylase family protein n=1 Tax=Microbacterium yannicii TaxID=671622 RepID=A0ABP9MGE3_9MICO|nr:carboxymuconolactone decarboxylase family protein [Microbacterium yannicii]MCO5952989.1 carboxymuconolactone decarboxylase family protein [Microbacterium yannicii]
MTLLNDSLVPVSTRLDFDALAPVFSRAVNQLDEAATQQLELAGIDEGLRELVRLRASQINGCAYCVDLHSRTARSVGVTAQRVDALAVWRESGLFTAAQRAAFALTEDVTRLSETHVPEEVLAEAVAEFGEEGAAALVSLIIAINVWNAIGVTTRAWSVTPRSA